MVTQTGRDIVALETDRVITLTGLGFDWNAAGYTLKLRLTTPDGATTTDYTLSTVSGETGYARKTGSTGMFPVAGTYAARVIAFTGATESLLSEVFPIPVRG